MKYLKFTLYFLIYIISSYFVFASFSFISILILYHLLNISFPSLETYYKFILILSPFIFLLLFFFFYLKKYIFKLRFWILYGLIPLLFTIFFNTLFPSIYYSFSKSEVKKFKEIIGMNALSDFYFSEEENANALLEENRDIIIKIYQDIGPSANIFDSEFINKNKEKLKKEIKPLIELSEKITEKKMLQKSNPSEYEEKSWEMGIPDYINLLAIQKANLIDAVINFEENKLDEAKKALERSLKIARLSLTGPGLISGVMGLVCYNLSINTILYLLKSNPEKTLRFSDVINEFHSELRTLPLLMPHKNYMYKNKILIAPGLNKELYHSYKMLLFGLKEIDYKPYFNLFYKLFGEDIRNMNPVQNFFRKTLLLSIPPIFYYSFFKYYKEYLPKKFESKYDYIKWYLNKMKGKQERFGLQKDYGIPVSDYFSIIGREINTLTLSNVLTSVLKIENFKMKNGYYPDEFEETEEDLYTGKKLIYKKLDNNSYVIYSVGNNLIDDGGKIENQLDLGFKR